MHVRNEASPSQSVRRTFTIASWLSDKRKMRLASARFIKMGVMRPNSSTSINMRAQLAPITFVAGLPILPSSSIKQPRRKQIVTGFPLPTHRGQARHRQRDHNVDLVLLLQLVEPPASR